MSCCNPILYKKKEFDYAKENRTNDRRVSMITIKKLNNGVRLVLEEIPYVRSISFGIWVRNGSRNETEENGGISHYIEHMLFKGTENRSAKEIAEEMDALGGQINAYTTKEYTCYHTRILDRHFDRALDVMSDMFFHSKFAEKDIERERNVITEEILMYDDSPEDMVHDALQEAIWKGSSLGRPILGTTESISHFNTEGIKDYFSKNYNTENTVLSIAGNFKEKEILEKVNRAFGDWDSEESSVCHDTKTEYTPVVVKKEKDIEQMHLCLAFPGPERDHPNKYAMAIFNTIFGGGMSSRLFQKVREENGLTYTIYSYTSAYTDAGLFAIYASMNPNQTEQVMDLIFQEIREVKKEKISEKVINITKEQLISNFIIGTESTSNRMTSNGASIMLRGFAQSTEEILESIENITAEDIQRVIDSLFDRNKMSLSAVGNIKNIDFDKILKSTEF